MEQRGGELILFIIVLSVLGLFLVLIFLIFLKRKNTLIKSKKEAEANYKQELIKTQIEIREETLRNISWELHDNIGQLMTLAKIQIQNIANNPNKIDDVTDTISNGLDELRALSKSINPDTIKKLNLEAALKLDLSRFDKLNFLKTTFSSKGLKQQIDPNASIVLFRILQEFFSNTIKHSKASELIVELKYSETVLNINVTDNGIGFNSNSSYNGQGLENMKNRADLIGAEILLTSKPNIGTVLNLIYPYTNSP